MGLLSKMFDEDKKKETSKYKRAILGECTELAWQILHGQINVKSRIDWESLATIVRCVKCELVDAILRAPNRDGSLPQFRMVKRCERCNGRLKRVMMD